MFDVTDDEIKELNDVDLRELVARLCEAELASRGLSPVHVTWGGNQTAADGGLDVRVELPAGTNIDGFIPRSATGFQVKKPDMPAAKIRDEMRPGDVLRPVIQRLADDAGSYIIVSSKGTVADVALGNRRTAMRGALADVANADQLHTDFYDRRRLATWVRRHPSVITWVKRRLGRALSGWQPYGPWSYAGESVEAEYLLDDELRLHLGKHRDAPAQPVVEAIDDLRDEIAQPGKVVRLVGLSGVGKTRLVQALFDARIGSRPLDRSLAVYTNLSDNPDPQPTGVASDLLANSLRAVLIIDNCPPELHGGLAKLCGSSDSTVSVITVEYDVRADQPEGTHVVRLDTSSLELIGTLVRKRYTHISEVDARTIAEVSDGNARVALALAGTVTPSDSIAGLSDDDLFQRLFRQRHEADTTLLRAAQACSLVYSFQGEALTGADAELPQLAVLAELTPQTIFRQIGTLVRRDLVQKRGVWRAVLPHAIANRLAAHALEDIPFDVIDQQIVAGGTDRLTRSFSRRLAYLHDRPEAIAIVKQWLTAGGLLGNVAALDGPRRAMFVNVAPVLPEAALAALERVENGDPELAASVWADHRSLLHSLAYDASLFSRSATLLARAATQCADERDARDVSGTFASLFTLYLSGTHATIDQRLEVIERLLRSDSARDRKVGLAALDEVLETSQFSSGHQFDFGGRSRDYGYQPTCRRDVKQWYRSAMALIERLALTEGLLKPQLSNLLAQNFRFLWASARMFGGLIRLSRGFSADGFWRDGWVACRETMRFDRDRLSPANLGRLDALEAKLRPSALTDRVRAVALGARSGGLDLDDFDLNADPMNAGEGLDTLAQDLGRAVAVDEAAFAELLPDLLQRGIRTHPFGHGLASASRNPSETWTRLSETLVLIEPDQRETQVLRGFLAALWDRDQHLAQSILDDAFDQPILRPLFPSLQTAVPIDSRGIVRLKRAFGSEDVPIWACQVLIFGGLTAQFSGNDLGDLLIVLADRPDGLAVALHIIQMRFFSDRSDGRAYEPELLETGRKLLSRLQFRKSGHSADHRLAEVAGVCLSGTGAAPLAGQLASRVRAAVAAGETYDHDNADLVTALLRSHPMPVLDALLKGNPRAQRSGVSILKDRNRHRPNAIDAVSVQDLISWCDRDREARYPLVASFVTYAHRVENGPRSWSEQAQALLTHAPDPQKVLAELISQFRRDSWSGSLAALMEADAALLDNLPPEIQAAGFSSYVAAAKAQLAREIADRWEHETKREQERDERFE